MRTLTVSVGLLLAACANSGGAVASAVATTAIAAGVAAARRADGQCYTPCTPGTKCNEKTGECEPLPCRGECRPDEHCEQTYLGEKCVPDLALELRGTATTTGSPAAQAAAAAPDAGVAPTARDAPLDVPRLADAPRLEPR